MTDAAGSSLESGKGGAVASRGGSPFTLRDLLISGAYHRRIILATFLLTVLLGFGAAQLAPRTFEAEGRLIVLAGRDGQLAVSSLLPGQSGSAMETELEILRSRQVVEEAVLNIGAERIYSLSLFGHLRALVQSAIGSALWSEEEKGPELRPVEATERLRRDLRIAQTGNATIIRIGYGHPDRRVAIEVVDTVILSYLTRRRELFEEVRSPFLQREVERYRRELAGLERQIQDAKAEFDVLDLTQEVLLAVNQIDSIEHRRRNLLERREALVAEVSAAERTLAELPVRLFDYRETTNRTDNDEARNRLLLLRVERANLAERYADDYPRLAEIDQEIAAIRQFSDSERPNYTSLREVRNPATDFLTNHLLTLQIEQDAVNRQVEELLRQEQGARQRVLQLRLAEERLQELERSREVIEEVYREYAKEAETARLDEDALRQQVSNVRVIDWADAPLRTRSMALNFALAGVVGGLFFGALAGLGAAWNRQVFVLPMEAERTLAMPILAVFNEHQETARLPGSADDVAYLATRILDHREQEGALRTLQFLALDSFELQRKLVRAVARELAVSHQRRVLLLDLSGRTTQDPADAVPAAAPRRQAAGAELVESEVAGLWLSRDIARSPLSLMRTERAKLREAMAELSKGFDLVLVEVPTFGSSHLGLRIAPVVDASIMVLRAEVTRIPVALRVRDDLLDAGGDIFGAVVTGRRFHLPRMLYRWL